VPVRDIRQVMHGNSAAAIIFQNQIGTFIPEQNLNAMVDQPILNCTVQLLRLFRTEMTNRTINEL
jgi:hypothetical protein